MRTMRACGKALGERALEALRAVPEGHEVDVAAVGTRPREPLDVAAMVTAQIRRFAVHDEPGAAPRATGLPAARRAEERERESAPVDEDERLLAAIEPRRERRQQRHADAFDGSCVAVADEPEVGEPRRNHRAPRQQEPR